LLEKAKQRLAGLPQGNNILREKLQADIEKYSKPVTWENTSGANLYGLAGGHALGRPAKTLEEAAPVASQYLRAKGVAGIKYLAGQNFNVPKGAEGTHNYVTFNAPRILKRYAIPGAIGATGFGALARPPKEERQ
jgi:hypothetical protein